MFLDGIFFGSGKKYCQKNNVVCMVGWVVQLITLSLPTCVVVELGCDKETRQELLLGQKASTREKLKMLLSIQLIILHVDSLTVPAKFSGYYQKTDKWKYTCIPRKLTELSVWGICLYE